MLEILLYFAPETTPQRRKMVRTPCTKLPAVVKTVYTPCTKRPAVVKNGLYTLYKASRSSERRFVHPVQNASQ